jgi:hypothetical protein
MSQVIVNSGVNGVNPSVLIGPSAGSSFLGQLVGGNLVRFFPPFPNSQFAGVSFPSTLSPNTVGSTSTGLGSGQGPVTSANSKTGFLFVLGNGQMNGQRMTIRGGGDLSIGAVSIPSPAVTISLYAVTVGGPGAGSNSYTPTLVTVPVTSGTSTPSIVGYYPWNFSVDLAGTTNSGLVQALANSFDIDGTSFGVASSGLVSGLSNINFNNPIPFGFCIGVEVLGLNINTDDFSFQANLYQFDLSV